MRQFMNLKSFALFSLAAIAAPTFAATTIHSPSNGDSVSSPFTLSAEATTCSSERVNSITYSLGNWYPHGSCEGLG